MTYWLSQPVEVLCGNPVQCDVPVTVDTLIVGSGYGAAMAALALSETQTEGLEKHSVVVFERGDEYLPHDFPRTLGELPGHVPDNLKGNTKSGLWDVRAGKGAVSISGNGLGGTSLVNASVAIAPDKDTLDHWPDSGVKDDWQSLFSRCYPKINQLLGVQSIADPERFNKYKALYRTAKSIDPGASVRAAPVAINFDGPGSHSVEHQACNHCGNCVIGCHSGAKQSLNLNAWPLAKQQGVELYTGATVRYLHAFEGRYQVHCRTSKNDEGEFVVVARRVILAAGAIGSTEILSRSSHATDTVSLAGAALSLSPELGKNFSANGDGLIFTSGEENRVDAIADVPDVTADSVCGPTIVGIARANPKPKPETNNTTSDAKSTNDLGRLTIEDGAIPYPLAEVWRETLTMQSYIRRFVSDTRSKWHTNNPEHDPLASSNSMAKNSQVILVMGFDGSPGELVKDHATGNLLPKWPERQAGTGYYNELHQSFKSAHSDAYAGGEYHPNPLLQMLPEEFNQVFEGADQIPRNIVTVHPLGGCVMGESSDRGVVNSNGEVFKCEDDKADTTSVYKDLYVLDGSILPGAVGVNPMITISALSYTLASRIAGRESPLADPFDALIAENRRIPLKVTAPVDRDKTINARFNERLLWDLTKERDVDIDQLKTLFGSDIPNDVRTIVLDVAFYFEDSDDGESEYRNSLDKWLCDPAKPLRASAVLMASKNKLLHSSADTFVPMPVLMRFDGEVTLGSRDDRASYFRGLRVLSALWRLVYYRPYLFTGAFGGWIVGLCKRFFAAVDGNSPADSKPNDKKLNEKKPGYKKTGDKKTGALERAKGFLRIAGIHTDWRYLQYELTESDNPTPLIVSGRKALAYTPRAKSLWESLLILPTVFRRGEISRQADLSVDLLRITKGPSPLQITRSPDEPTSLAAIGGFGLLLARLLGSTHFWSFGAHSYHKFIGEKEFDIARRRKPLETTKFLRDGTSCESLPVKVFELRDPVQTENDTGTQQELLARLLRYREDHNPDRPAVLLVHGLSHSSEIFWPEYVSETYVQYLLKQGYDVWVFDHRTSGNTRHNVNKDHTWDDIAMIDVPWAVATVYKTINAENDSDRKRLVNVFSHCIGAGAVAMAVLAGNLQRPDNKRESMLGSLIPHAVTPWVFSSCDNRTRANLWGFVKDFNLLDILDPRMHSKPGMVNTILDRIATSTIDANARKQWPFLKNLFVTKPNRNEYAMAMYFRYTVFWGRQWVHHNVTDKLKKRFPTMVGEVPATILQQTYFSVRRKRLVSQQADNRYVIGQQFENHWTFPTLFLHGESNEVFDVESSRLSAFNLARFRHDNTDAAHDEPFSREDYATHGVELETIPDYGHMDMIIGDKATTIAGPIMHRFFSAAEKQNHDWQKNPQKNPLKNAQTNSRATRSYAVFEARYSDRQSVSSDQPLTRTRASKFPFTGPIVSHADKDSFRVWIEADDYDTEAAIGIEVTTDSAEDLAITQESFEVQTGAQRGYFRGVRINQPQNLNAPVHVGLRHREEDTEPCEGAGIAACNVIQHSTRVHTGSQDFGRQRDVDRGQGVTLNLHTMPWFKRLYGDDRVGRGGDFSFIAGSCLHPGSLFTRDLSDSIFNAIWEQISESTSATDFLLLLGDQIYADATAGLFDPKASYERYRMRYREAFGARGLRRVLSHIPTYFVVDDHAYKDNYSGKLEPDEVSDFEIAKAEAKHFQSPWSPSTRLWSEFEIQGHPFFCFDTRFERCNRRVRTDPLALIGREQAAAFKTWVAKNRHCDSLFLCTGSPLLPVRAEYVSYPHLRGYSDTLVSYDGFLAYLIAALADCQCRNIYLLSGDPHLSCRGTAVLSSGGRSVRLEQIVASPLNAPYPFANARNIDYVWGEEQEVRFPESGMSLQFRQELLSTATQQFCRMDYAADSGILYVKVYSPNGVESGAEEVSYS